MVASAVPPCQSTSAGCLQVPASFLPAASPEETVASVETCVDSRGVVKLSRTDPKSSADTVACAAMREEPQRVRERQHVELKPLFVELCAGAARLSSAVTRRDVDAMAIDISSARSEGHPICCVDLANPCKVEEFIRCLEPELPRLRFVFAAPPCGTASRARERPIPGVPNPPAPLRSSEFPDGVGGLAGADKLKTGVFTQ